MDWNVVIGGAAVVLTILGAEWKLYSSIDRKFTEVKNDILQKLEYHERHDDRRFLEINDNIWMVRLRLAAKDGVFPNIQLEKKEND